MMRDTVDRETPAFTAISSRFCGCLVKVVVGFTGITIFIWALFPFGSALKFSDNIIVGFSKVCQAASETITEIVIRPIQENIGAASGVSTNFSSYSRANLKGWRGGIEGVRFKHKGRFANLPLSTILPDIPIIQPSALGVSMCQPQKLVLRSRTARPPLGRALAVSSYLVGWWMV